MTASAPAATAAFSFAISSSIDIRSFEVPMFALILVRSPFPTPSGVMDVCRLFRVMTMVPLATPSST